MPPPGPLTRLQAWLVTGPVGHLVAGTLDSLALIGRIALARARGRDPFGG